MARYYNKEYREGFLRGFVLTAAVDSHRSRRLRWLSTAKVCTNSRGKSQRYFFILSTVPNPLRCLNMSKSLKTNDLSCLRRVRTLPSRRLDYRFKTSGEFDCTKRLKGRTPRRILDHYFNVCLGVSGREMELTRT